MAKAKTEEAVKTEDAGTPVPDETAVESTPGEEKAEEPTPEKAEKPTRKKAKTVVTAMGEERLVPRRVKMLSVWWHVLVPSPYVKDQFMEQEHRGVQGEDIELPLSYAKRYDEMGAFFTKKELADPSATPDPATPVSQMSDVELINWHRSNSPTPQEMLDAAGGDPALARRLANVESAATGGDPRDAVIMGLAEIVARGNS